MDIIKTSVLVVIISFCAVLEVNSHGRLMVPPARNSMWRYGYPTPQNYDDNQNWCGGAENYTLNGEKCGICGDNYADPKPRAHETGGPYATGLVVRRYAVGQIIDVEVQLTANHKGYFEFRICPANDNNVEVTQECLDRNLLKLIEADGKTWNNRYYITTSDRMKNFNIKVKLPPHVTCNRCIFQWTYVAANTWGVCDNGTEANGCGPQETFVNCADVGVTMNSGSIPPGQRPVYVTPPKNAIYVPDKENGPGKMKLLVIRSQVCVGTDEHKNVPGIDDWCQKNCLRYPQNCPEDKCKCLDGCHAIGNFKEKEGSDTFCQYNCLVYPPKNCSMERCACT